MSIYLAPLTSSTSMRYCKTDFGTGFHVHKCCLLLAVKSDVHNTFSTAIGEFRKPMITVGICADIETDSVVNIVNRASSDVSKSDRIVVVTPNGRLAEMLRGMRDKVTVVLESEREGKTAAMNKLLRNVSDGVLVYVSGDVAVGVGTISSLVDQLLEDRRFGAVIGHVVVANGREGIMGRVGALIWGLFNNVSLKLSTRGQLAQPNDMYAVWRGAVDYIPAGTINDDTYLMMTVKKYDLLVRKTHVGYYIVGPSTPLDYVLQRSRITLGHLQTVKMTGKTPTIFEYSALRNLKTFISVIAEGGKVAIIATIVAAVLELVSWFHAALSTILRRNAAVWRQATSTKDILIHLRMEHAGKN